MSVNKKIKGFINCPIEKKLIKTSKIYGVTEYLARKSNVNNSSEVMLLFNRKFSVVPLTTHVNIKNIAKKITKSIIIQKIKTIHNYYKKILN